MEKKLKLDDKVNIVLSRDQSLRKIAEKYQVHHSTIDDIFLESKELLTKYWEAKSNNVGRPKQTEPIDEDTEKLQKELAAAQKELAIRQMKLDYANLQLKWANERIEEKNARERKKQLKKKKKKG